MRPATALARRILLPPLAGGVAAACLLLAVAVASEERAKSSNPLAGTTVDVLVHRIAADLEGVPTLLDVQRARRSRRGGAPAAAAHPYAPLYRTARREFGVSSYLVAAIHYQETGFRRAPRALAAQRAWRRYRFASHELSPAGERPAPAATPPSVGDRVALVMAIAAQLRDAGAGHDLGAGARRALAERYGSTPRGRVSAAMVLERARSWRVLGTLPKPGRGELARPVAGVVGGCGYFGCPRPGHAHNGVDLLAPHGTPVRASDAGRVALIESVAESSGYGNFVCVQHRPALATCYAHLSAVDPAIVLGARVRRGSRIGRVGATGSASTPHLHFEVRRGAAACSECAVDPLPLLSGEIPARTVAALLRAARAAAPRPLTTAAAAPVTAAPVVAMRETARMRPAPPARRPLRVPVVRPVPAPAPAPPVPPTPPPVPIPAVPAAPAPDPAPPVAPPGPAAPQGGAQPAG